VAPKNGSATGGELVDLDVAVHGLLSGPAGCQAGGIHTVGEHRDRVLEGVGDRPEMPLVVGDECRIALRGETVGKVECAGGESHGH